MSHLEHKAAAPASIRCFVLTVSDTRTEQNDVSGHAILELLESSGHHVTGRAIVKDEPAQVDYAVRAQLAKPDVQVILTTGGTGISTRDRSFEAISGILEKKIDGFGELFRMLSYEAIGPAAMLSRACAGAARGKIIISLPGSENAVRLAMTKLVLPELGHMVREVGR